MGQTRRDSGLNFGRQSRRRGPLAVALGGLGLLAMVTLGQGLRVDVPPLLLHDAALAAQPGQGRPVPSDQDLANSLSDRVARDESTWSAIFRDQVGRPYNAPELVLFTGLTQSPCGGAVGATGPFYCAVDRKIYLDTAFFRALRAQPGGERAVGYVVGHLMAHHAQNELGLLAKASALRRTAAPGQAEEITARVELQADCLAGIWAAHATEPDAAAPRPDGVARILGAARSLERERRRQTEGRVPLPHSFLSVDAAARRNGFKQGHGGRLADCRRNLRDAQGDFGLGLGSTPY